MNTEQSAISAAVPVRRKKDEALKSLSRFTRTSEDQARAHHPRTQWGQARCLMFSQDRNGHTYTVLLEPKTILWRKSCRATWCCAIQTSRPCRFRTTEDTSGMPLRTRMLTIFRPRPTDLPAGSQLVRSRRLNCPPSHTK